MTSTTIVSTVALAVLVAATPVLAQSGAGTAGAGSAKTSADTMGSANTAGGTMTTGSTTASNAANSTGTVNNSTNWNTENTYWRNHYSSRPYYSNSTGYSTYEPAYQYGVTMYNQNNGRPYSDLNQTQLNSGWAQARGTSNLTWSQAQAATQDAYNRLYTQNHNANLSSAPATTTR